MFWLALLGAAALGALIVWVILREETIRLRERLAAMGASREQVSSEFRALAADALRGNNEQFLHLAESTLERKQSAVDELVKPLKASLEKVDAHIHAMEMQRSGAYATLTQQVRNMAETQVKLSDETRRLVEALRTPATRGRWGEIQLKRVVEMAGMVAYCDFAEQQTAGAEGSRIRPDLIVRLPNEKWIVVDSKVPLKGYLESLEETTEAGRTAKLKQHALQIRNHLRSLSEKAYWAQFQPAPEFAILFLPGEIFFSAALQQDPELIEFGVSQNVILATPTTLIALLKAVAFGWKQDQFTENAKEVLDLGCTLYERIRLFTEHYNEIGKNLNRAATAYNKANSSLETRLLPAAKRFEALGVSKGDPMPELVDAEQVPWSLRAS